jgi:hypothetical protein
MIIDPKQYIQKLSDKIINLKSKRIHSLYEFSIQFQSSEIAMEVKKFFQEQGYSVQFDSRKCNCNSYDIIISGF